MSTPSPGFGNPDPWDTTQGNRFAGYTPDNHSAGLWICSILGLIYTTLTFGIRFFIKRSVFGIDDWTILVGTVIGGSQFAVLYQALGDGLGKSPAFMSNQSSTARLVFSTRILLLVSIYFSKCSLILLLRRLFVHDDGIKSFFCHVFLSFTAGVGVASVCLASTGCPSASLFSRHCSSQIVRWSVIFGLDVLTEIMALAIPICILWPLRMKKGDKMKVITAFSLRVGVLICSAFYLISWMKYTSDPPSSLTIVPNMLWQQVLLTYSLISATIPNLKVFIESLGGHLGNEFGYSTYPYGTDTYEMSSVGEGTSNTSRSGSEVVLSR